MNHTSKHSVTTIASGIVMGAAALGAPATASAQTSSAQKPTVVLVHGAWADASSWNGVIRILHGNGYTVVAAANPLRSLKGDAASVNTLVRSIHGPVVLVGHSYGGAVITDAVSGLDNVKALVYVAGYAPDKGESAISLTGRFTGSAVETALAQPVSLPEGGVDLYIQQGKFHSVIAADVPEGEASLMAAEQRPATQAALTAETESAGWKTIPSWFIYGSADMAIPAAAHAFMAERAKARKTMVVNGASHLVMVSHPNEVAALIEQAAQSK